MDGPDVSVVRHVLAGLVFPASRWQLIATADLYGADVTTRERLHELPVRVYADWAEVDRALRSAAAVEAAAGESGAVETLHRPRPVLGHRAAGRNLSRNSAFRRAG